MHLSQSDKGHYVAYSNYNGIWNKYNDDEVTTSVTIDGVKDKAYYYCYRRVTKDYSAQVERIARAKIVERQCAYCDKVVIGPATYHVPGVGVVEIAGAMVDHLKQCVIIVSSHQRIKLALEKDNKEHLIIDLPSQDIRTFFSEAS